MCNHRYCSSYKQKHTHTQSLKHDLTYIDMHVYLFYLIYITPKNLIYDIDIQVYICIKNTYLSAFFFHSCKLVIVLLVFRCYRCIFFMLSNRTQVSLHILNGCKICWSGNKNKPSRNPPFRTWAVPCCAIICNFPRPNTTAVYSCTSLLSLCVLLLSIMYLSFILLSRCIAHLRGFV